MGTEIALSVGGIDVSWSKNSMGIDHGHLFQPADLKRCRSDQIDYDCFTEEGDDDALASMEIGFVKPIREVLPRLELLGFSLARVKRDYERAAEESAEENRQMSDLGVPKPEEFVDFETFLKFINGFALCSVTSWKAC